MRRVKRVVGRLILIFGSSFLGACGQRSVKPITSATPEISLGAVLFEAADSDARARLIRGTNAAGDELRIFIAEIHPHSISKIHLRPSERPQPLDAFISEGSPTRLAINGGFYAEKKPMGLVKAAKKELSPLSHNGGSGIFFVTNGTAGIVHRDEYQPSGEERLALQSIDRLIDRGESLVSETASRAKDARSAVALRGDTVIFAAIYDVRAVDTLSTNAFRLNADSTKTGVSLGDWAMFLSDPDGEVRADTALNLDGGFSTSFHVRLADQELSLAPHRATMNALALE